MSDELWKCIQFEAGTQYAKEVSTRDLLKKRVCIIGGGVTGLGISGILSLKGISNVILDKKDALGGIWADRDFTYAGLKIHAPSYYFQYLDDEVNCDAEFLLNSRRDVREQLAYFTQYARKHRVLFLGGVEVSHDHANIVNVKKINGANISKIQFDWVIDCTATRTNSGVARLLPGTQILREDILLKPKSTRIIVVGAGKGGADAVTYLTKHQFENVTWLCSRKIGFMPRELFYDRERLFKRYEQIGRMWLVDKKVDIFSQELVTPHDTIDCYKFGIISQDELEVLRSTKKVYGRVKAVNQQLNPESKLPEKKVLLADGTQITADVVISAIGSDYNNHVEIKKSLVDYYLKKNKKLLLDSIDEENQIGYVSNYNGEAATGASLEGLLLAGFISGQITAAQIRSIQRVLLALPENIGACLLGGSLIDNKSDGLIREKYILELLGFPEQYSFRLLDKSIKMKLLSL